MNGVTYQTFGHATANYILEQLTEEITVAKATMAVLGEAGVITDFILKPQPTKPAIR